MASKGLWIPQEIMKLEDIDFISKGILSEITSLSKLDKGCYISNNKLAEMFDISLRTAIRRIQELKKLGYIKIKIINKDDNVSLRKMYPTYENITTGGVSNLHGGGVKKGNKVVSNCHPINSSLPKGREMNTENFENQKTSSKVSDFKNKKIKPKYGMVEANLEFILEEKVGNKARMVFANMNIDENIPTKKDMVDLIHIMSKEELIEFYGKFS